jgi:hypothetical protein
MSIFIGRTIALWVLWDAFKNRHYWQRGFGRIILGIGQFRSPEGTFPHVTWTPIGDTGMAWAKNPPNEWDEWENSRA